MFESIPIPVDPEDIDVRWARLNDPWPHDSQRQEGAP
jgi:hypothetical protein